MPYKGLKKLECCPYYINEKSVIMFIRPNRIPAFYGQTDRQTDGIGETLSRSACIAR